MVVKAKRGRRRYIVFEVSPNLDKGDLIRMTNSVCGKDESLYIIQCGSGKAVIRCAPGERDRTAELMSLADPGCVSLKTSGTLKTLRDIYPELKVPSKRRR